MTSTVIPGGADGIWRMSTLDSEQARTVAAAGSFISAVRHDSSAQAMSVALGVTVTTNRITVIPQPGDSFLCTRPLPRAPEGVVLDLADLGIIGYGWALLEYLG